MKGLERREEKRKMKIDGDKIIGISDDNNTNVDRREERVDKVIRLLEDVCYTNVKVETNREEEIWGGEG